jgi:hypothetical protein
MLKGLNHERGLFFAAILLAVFPIWGVYFPLGLDLPEHALVMQVVASGRYDAGPDYHGQLCFNPLWAPYSLLYVAAIPLVRAANALVALKLLLTFTCVGAALALRRLLAQTGGDPFAFYFAFPFLFSSAYLAGFLPYLFGFPLVLLLAGDVLRQPAPTRRNLPLRLAAMFLLAWAHPTLYSAAAALLAAMVFALLWKRAAKPWDWIASLLWLGLPALYVAAWTTVLFETPGVSWGGKFTNLQQFFYNIGAYDLHVFERPFWIVKVPLLAWLAWLFWSWAACRRLRASQGTARREQAPALQAFPSRALLLALAMLLALTALLPEGFGGQMVTPTFRFTPLAALLAAPLLPASATRPRLARFLLVAWCFGALAGACLLAWRFNRQLDGFVRLAQRMEAKQVTALAYEGQENMLFAHALSYYNLEKGGINAACFLVRDDMSFLPAHLLAPRPWGAAWDERRHNPVTHPGARAFRYLLIKTSRPATEPPPALLFHRLAAREAGWLLFERKPETWNLEPGTLQ